MRSEAFVILRKAQLYCTCKSLGKQKNVSFYPSVWLDSPITEPSKIYYIHQHRSQKFVSRELSNLHNKHHSLFQDHRKTPFQTVQPCWRSNTQYSLPADQ